MRALISRELFELPVLSYNELVPTLTLDVVHQVPPLETAPLTSVK